MVKGNDRITEDRRQARESDGRRIQIDREGNRTG
jgi:hypothetical protein